MPEPIVLDVTFRNSTELANLHGVQDEHTGEIQFGDAGGADSCQQVHKRARFASVVSDDRAQVNVSVVVGQHADPPCRRLDRFSSLELKALAPRGAVESLSWRHQQLRLSSSARSAGWDRRMVRCLYCVV